MATSIMHRSGNYFAPKMTTLSFHHGPSASVGMATGTSLVKRSRLCRSSADDSRFTNITERGEASPDGALAIDLYLRAFGSVKLIEHQVLATPITRPPIPPTDRTRWPRRPARG
ncbi:MAG: hypothetical protein WBL23_04465 [Salinisphaera sp.]|uniref:hypothetical protein n=1 Tax=Salinisphaera sp. TaxID=1914330 RepID=UPI003C7E296C